MRILLIAALLSSVAVAGCRGGEKNSSTSANNSASATSSAAGGAGGAAADAYRASSVEKCERALKSIPNAPPGFDAAGTCRCAIQTAFGNQADPQAFERSDAGRRALTDAIINCGQQSMGAAAGKGEKK
jgi:hypothetical protein